MSILQRASAAVGALALGLALWAAPAAGQGSLLDQAKGALKGMGGGSGGGMGSSLGTGEIAAGLREALKVGTERVVGQVGATDGYNGDPTIRIPLPGALKDVQKVLRKVGQAGLADDLELRLNRAAEAAAPEAKALFVDAISQMTLDDVEGIYNGPDDAATRYFQGKMTPPLAERMAPIVDRTLADVGAIRSYDAMMGQYKSLPFMPDVKADLTEYVVAKAMDGLFHYVAEEEAAIRNNPAARSTALLQKVFGGR
jgi:hypothetical protein